MPETVEILCLANSRKYSGRCVAGLRTDGGGWVRPVSAEQHRALSPQHYTLNDFTEARPLDLIRVPIACPAPLPHHPEDCRIAYGQWELSSRPAPKEVAVPLLRRHLVRGTALLGDTENRLPHAAFSRAPAAASLALVWPKDLFWSISLGANGKRRTRVQFRLTDPATADGAEYDLSLTDSDWEERLGKLGVGLHPMDAAPDVGPKDRLLLTVSLSEPFSEKEDAEPSCYKLVAAVLKIPSEWRGPG
jgi:hypothetical protein